MATSSWPEVADNAVARLPVEALTWGFWLLLGLVVLGAIPFIGRLLRQPPTADEIAEALVSRGWSPGAAPSLRQLEKAVHRGVNGTAERVKRVEDTLTNQDGRLDAIELTLARIDERIKGILARSHLRRSTDDGQ